MQKIFIAMGGLVAFLVTPYMSEFGVALFAPFCIVSFLILGSILRVPFVGSKRPLFELHNIDKFCLKQLFVASMSIGLVVGLFRFLG